MGRGHAGQADQGAAGRGLPAPRRGPLPGRAPRRRLPARPGTRRGRRLGAARPASPRPSGRCAPATRPRAVEAARQATGSRVGDPGVAGPLGELRHALDRRPARRRPGARPRPRPVRRRSRTPSPGSSPCTSRPPTTPRCSPPCCGPSGTTSGVAAALGRYAAYRSDVADRLGVDPDPALQRIHRELLAADSPHAHRACSSTPTTCSVAPTTWAGCGRRWPAGGSRPCSGPGGIGKTRIVHVLAREATQPRVHVVELVGVGSSDDVVAEVGAALGIGGSVTTRRTLTPAQQADVRGRIAQELDSGPALLVLDNCEHVLEATASLVAFLLATTRDLSVLTTSRAPLRIAAERIVPLTQLSPEHAADLFVRRAAAVRPGVVLDPATVAAVVERLDGLPLAIELAAARVRTMSVEELRTALDDRFGAAAQPRPDGPRAAPHPHRRHRVVVGPAAPSRARRRGPAVGLPRRLRRATPPRASSDPTAWTWSRPWPTSRSSTVTEVDGATRFRMLETIREFAGLRLVESGDHDAAAGRPGRLGHRPRRPPTGRCSSPPTRSADRPVLLAEENNLTDVLRRALAAGDAPTAARLLGHPGQPVDHHRQPRAHLRRRRRGRRAARPTGTPPTTPSSRRPSRPTALMLVHLSWIPERDTRDLRAAMERWGHPEHPWPRVDVRDVRRRTTSATSSPASSTSPRPSPTPRSAAMLLMWAAINAENVGDIPAAVRLLPTRPRRWRPHALPRRRRCTPSCRSWRCSPATTTSRPTTPSSPGRC